jgi:hypothetical protein
MRLSEVILVLHLVLFCGSIILLAPSVAFVLLHKKKGIIMNKGNSISRIVIKLKYRAGVSYSTADAEEIRGELLLKDEDGKVMGRFPLHQVEYWAILEPTRS